MESFHQRLSIRWPLLVALVRSALTAIVLLYVCVTVVDVQGSQLRQQSHSQATQSVSTADLRRPNIVYKALKKLWQEAPQLGTGHQTHSISHRFGAEWTGARKLSARGPEIGLRLKLLHRNSAASPFRKEYDCPGDALQEDIEMDAVRLAGFKRRLQSIYVRKVAGIVSAPNSPVTAVVEPGSPTQSPAQGPSTYTFDSPVVSGSSLGSGQYFVDFYIGTPPQRFSLITDTGSDLIWLQCAPCKECYSQEGPFYIPSNSSSFKPVSCFSKECALVPAPLGIPCDFSGSCEYQYDYSDSSSSRGVLAYEIATMHSSDQRSVKIANVAFGCGSENQGSFAGAGGVIGMGQGPLSFTSQIGFSFGNTFSYCLVNYLDPTNVSSTLVFGDDTVLASKHTLHYTPILQNPHSQTLYYIGIEEVSVADQVLPISTSSWAFDLMGSGGSVFDSGTTLTYFVWHAYSAILSAFEKALIYPQVAPLQNLDLCFNVSGDSNPQLPAFAIRFVGGAVLEPPAENYFVDVAADIKCLAMQGVQTAFGFNTIGNLMQQNFLVVYDRGSSRLGFSHTQCDSL